MRNHDLQSAALSAGTDHDKQSGTTGSTPSTVPDEQRTEAMRPDAYLIWKRVAGPPGPAATHAERGTGGTVQLDKLQRDAQIKAIILKSSNKYFELTDKKEVRSEGDSTGLGTSDMVWHPAKRG